MLLFIHTFCFYLIKKNLLNPNQFYRIININYTFKNHERNLCLVPGQVVLSHESKCLA
jgi:hypothetical protein